MMASDTSESLFPRPDTETRIRIKELRIKGTLPFFGYRRDPQRKEREKGSVPFTALLHKLWEMPDIVVVLEQ